ncbi:unnamed protein product [Dovyalis caffra]|uniref:Uncharacterized protein n=1 Tax=Dovyalis caffra TaxID=77055 RepID=A0AAV1RKK8_9ROSI|nr:unnamed protein product [Dovyalis caffra]
MVQPSPLRNRVDGGRNLRAKGLLKALKDCLQIESRRFHRLEYDYCYDNSDYDFFNDEGLWDNYSIMDE